MKIYAIVGESQQTVVEDSMQYTPQPNEILMQLERPEGNYRATADGTWEEYTPVIPVPVEELVAEQGKTLIEVAEMAANNEVTTQELMDAIIELAGIVESKGE